MTHHPPDMPAVDQDDEMSRLATQVQGQVTPETWELFARLVLGEGDADVMFARGIAGPLGKLDCPLSTKVDEITNDRFRRECALNGTDPAGMLRDFAYRVAHGKTYRQMVAEKLIHEDERMAATRSLIGSFGMPESGAEASPDGINRGRA